MENRGTLQGKGSASSSFTSDNLGSYAHRQLQLARGASNAQQTQAAFRSSAKELQDARRRNDGLHEQNRRLRKELDEVKSAAAKTHGDVEGDDTMEDGPEELGDEERKGRIEKLRSSLPYLEETYGTDSDIFVNATTELEHHQRAQREAKPFKTHRTIMERKVGKLQRLQARDKERLTELHEAAEEIRIKITATSAAVAERDKELEAAEAELKELVLKAVGEEAAQPPTALDPAKSWENVVGTVAQLVKVPGVPSEFTCQLEGMFNQLRTMVTALQSHATANGVPYGVGQGEGCTGKHAEETPQLGAAQAERLHEQQSAAKKQRLQAAQTQHINRFIAHHRAEQHNGAASMAGDSGTSSTAAEPAPENGGYTVGGQGRGETTSSSSSGANQTLTVAVAAASAAEAAAAAKPAAQPPAEAATETPPAREVDDDPMHGRDVESEMEGLTDKEDEQVEALGVKLSPEQKGKFRAILQVRKARLARKTLRHK